MNKDRIHQTFSLSNSFSFQSFPRIHMKGHKLFVQNNKFLMNQEANTQLLQ